jgi:hypothetical protein
VLHSKVTEVAKVIFSLSHLTAETKKRIARAQS